MNRGIRIWTHLHGLLVVSMLWSLLIGGLASPAVAQASTSTSTAAVELTGGYAQISAGTQHSCAVTTDDSLVCWGRNHVGQVTPPTTGAYTEVSAGNHHNCALTTAGSLVCWGDNSAGQSTPPTTGIYTQVSAGATHACALTTTGSIVCWGDNTYGQTTPPTTDTYTQVSAGFAYTCALTAAGSIVCWGANDSNKATPPTTGTYTQVSAGTNHACALTTAGSLVCWGNISNGRTTPPTTANYSRIDAGYAHNCAMTTADSIACWGYNNVGQSTPPPTGTYTEVSAGGHHNCALTTAGSIVCWGFNDFGQINAPQDEAPPVVTVPADISIEATGPDGAVVTYAVSATDDVDGPLTATCDVASGSVFPIGTTTVTCSATDAALNVGQATFTVTVTDAVAPVVTVPDDMTVEATDASGAVVTYAVSATDDVDGALTPTCDAVSGSVFPIGTTTITCSATDLAGNVGQATFTITVVDSTAPIVTVPADITVASTDADGAVVTFDVTATDDVDGSLTATCDVASGSVFPLGTTTITCSATDAALNMGQASFTVTVTTATPPPTGMYPQISAGTQHSCAVTTDDSLVCWGRNHQGQATPPTTGAYTEVSAGNHHNCALTTAGSLVCWGDNSAGQSTPPTTGIYTQVSAGATHTCALTTTGSIVCWGDNTYGQTTPPTTATYTQVSAGFAHNCALTTTGSIVCWGYDYQDRATPPTTGTYIQVSAGTNHSCALTSAGSIVCWGANNVGQATPPTTGSYARIDAGYAHNCAMTTTDSIVCWGYNNVGQATPPPTAGTYTEVSAGGHHNCALTTAGSIVCWGFNDFGQINAPQDGVVDAVAPVVTVPAYITAEATGPDGAVVTFDVSATDDVDGSLTATCDVVSGSVFPIGTTTVTCSATDVAGNVGQATFTVTVVDTTAPGVTVPAELIVVEATDATGVVLPFIVSATDAVDGALTPTCDYPSLSLLPIGITIITCTANDLAGNVGQASFTVNVVDSTTPVVSVPDDITVEATDASGAVVTFDVRAADAVDGTLTPTCDVASGSVFPLGSTTVTCTASDHAGNQGRATFTITVRDTTGPVVTVPADFFASATGADGAVVTFDVRAADAVDGTLTPTCNVASGSVFPLGNTTVTCSASDLAGNQGQASFIVKVRDWTRPVVTVPATIVAEATSANGAVVTFNVTATDAVDGTLTPTCDVVSGSVFPLGNTRVRCAVTDLAGNRGEASFIVRVRDLTRPVVTVPANITTEATGAAGAVVTYDVRAADAVDGTLTPTCDVASGATFPLGSTTVTCTASDRAGNQAQATFTITVRDTTKPVVTVPATITAEATSADGAVVTFDVTASDAVDGALTPTCSPASGDRFPLGSTVVRCEVRDRAGNRGFAWFSIKVMDRTAPVITVPADITAEATGADGAVVTYNVTATDAVAGPVTPTCDVASGSVFPIGTTTVTCTASDPSGNQRQASFSVTVRDTLAPVVSKPTITVNETGWAYKASIPITVEWSGSDALGVTGYRLQLQINGGAWVSHRVYGTDTTRGLLIHAKELKRVRVRVRSIDAAGNLSTWKTSKPIDMTRIAAEDPAVTYTGTWKDGGRFATWKRESAEAGATASLTFTGTSIRWTSDYYYRRGLAEVSIDGVTVATVDLYAVKGQAIKGMTVFSATGLDPLVSHTITIKVLGTKHPDSAGRIVLVDTFVVTNEAVD